MHVVLEGRASPILVWEGKPRPGPRLAGQSSPRPAGRHRSLLHKCARAHLHICARCVRCVHTHVRTRPSARRRVHAHAHARALYTTVDPGQGAPLRAELPPGIFSSMLAVCRHRRRHRRGGHFEYQHAHTRAMGMPSATPRYGPACPKKTQSRSTQKGTCSRQARTHARTHVCASGLLSRTRSCVCARRRNTAARLCLGI